jgi:hypothetical protein
MLHSLMNMNLSNKLYYMKKLILINSIALFTLGFQSCEKKQSE